MLLVLSARDPVILSALVVTPNSTTIITSALNSALRVCLVITILVNANLVIVRANSVINRQQIVPNAPTQKQRYQTAIPASS